MRIDPVHALEHNLWELWSHFGRAPNCSLHDEGDVLWFETPISALPYNTVLRFAAQREVDARLDAVVERFRQRRVPALFIVHPSAAPTDLPDRLRQRGLVEIEVVPGMVADLNDLPEPSPVPAGIEVREVTGADAARQVFELIAWRWNIPEACRPHLNAFDQVFQVGTPAARVRCWLAWRDGAPVAKVVLHCAAGVAGVYGVVTKPEARGLGLARRLTIECLRAAREAGYSTGVLHSTPMAESLYAKLGFRPVASFRLFASEAAHL